MISLVRVDNRLIHGQVVEAWLPHLKVQKVAVADDEAAQSALIRAAMGLAVDGRIEVLIRPLAQVDYKALAAEPSKSLLLFREVAGVLQAKSLGLDLGHLNLGNVHFATGRKQVSSSVFISEKELEDLGGLAQDGVEVECRGVPSERPVRYQEMVEKFGKG